MCIYEWCCWFFFPTLASSPPTEEKVLTKITARDQVQVVLNRLHKLLRDFKMTSYTCTHRGYSKRWPINCMRQKKKKNCGSLQTVAPCFWCMQTLLCGSLEGDERLEVFLVLKSLQFGGWCSLRLDLRSTVSSLPGKSTFFCRADEQRGSCGQCPENPASCIRWTSPLVRSSGFFWWV